MNIPQLTYPPVNWIDGMKIARRHFTEWENFMHDQLRDSNALGLSRFRYGILPAENALDLQIQCDFNQQIRVQLRSCRAISPHGARIEVNTGTDSLTCTTSFSALAETYGLQTGKPQTFDVVLTVNPFTRIPSGEPILTETPPRHPHSRPDYRLDVVPSVQIRPGELSYQLIVGRVRYGNGEVQTDPDYLPACTSIHSLPRLQQWHQQFGKHLESLETNAYKILQRTKERDLKNSLQSSTLLMAERMAFILGDISTRYSWIIPYEPPIQMAEALLRPIQAIRVVMTMLSGREREEFIGYISEWADLTPGALEAQLNTTLQLPYEHTELATLLAELDTFYRTLSNVFYKLAQLDFIGKRKGQNVFIIEHEVKETPPDKPRSRWSPLG
ncbi:hypothetical protein [Spirosoma pollinicola]|uniref:Type VI secretion system baseplate subunit TssK n=1 Tax=Spirosoma pollinicola TaxID=2057025 RepID=A0A2K8ZBC8_9BACT|nr:hypothetical protein [Spirosoma pollinicola]AUD07154.1 hypothetical protein CWM47_04170 [Spirosoma pollinicola]